MQPIRSFVIRIYRQGKARVDGVVEDVKSGRSVAFHDSQELWRALHPRARARPPAAPAPATPERPDSPAD